MGPPETELTIVPSTLPDLGAVGCARSSNMTSLLYLK
jgi:hypothetical protein